MVPKKVEFENKQFVDIKLQVRYMSFSAHADAKGIMTLIKQCEPKNVVLVHGEASKMTFLHGRIKDEFHLDCYYPANGETICITTQTSLPVDVDINFLKRTINHGISDPKRQKLMHGTLTIRNDDENCSYDYKLNSKEKMIEYGIEPHQIKFKTFIKLHREPNVTFQSLEEIAAVVYKRLKNKLHDQHLVTKLNETEIQISQVLIQVQTNEEDRDLKQIVLLWPEEDDALGSFLLSFIQGLRKYLIAP